MTTLIALYTGDGLIGRCDAKCYNAWGPECHCICQGGNHGAGKQEATASTRELPASWHEQAETAGQIISVPGPSAMPATAPQDGRHDFYPARPAERPSGVKKPLTPKRPYRVVENDEYAAFLRRVIRAYSRRVATGDVEAITVMAALASDLEEATRQAITGLRGSGYSWADIAMRLGITRQGAQQRWGETPEPVTDPSSTRDGGGCP